MTLHFAYGSNMSRQMMTARCPGAAALATATLEDWRFVITADGYASVVPQRGGLVRGVLWRLGARDLAAINAYESVDSGLYHRRLLPVRYGGRRASALVYVARAGATGRPRPGYLGLVVAAARDWEFPLRYIQSLERWGPSRPDGVRASETGELAWESRPSSVV